jgi:hypothetical protein
MVVAFLGYLLAFGLGYGAWTCSTGVRPGAHDARWHDARRHVPVPISRGRRMALVIVWVPVVVGILPVALFIAVLLIGRP